MSFKWAIGILVTLGLGAAMSLAFKDWVIGMALGGGVGIALGLTAGGRKSNSPEE